MQILPGPFEHTLQFIDSFMTMTNTPLSLPQTERKIQMKYSLNTFIYFWQIQTKQEDSRNIVT